MRNSDKLTLGRMHIGAYFTRFYKLFGKAECLPALIYTSVLLLLLLWVFLKIDLWCVVNTAQSCNGRSHHVKLTGYENN